jgi:hypothetical protein
MTGPCSGAGVGVAKPGFAATQFIGPAAIGGALAGLAGWQGAAVGATIGFLTYELATFCPSTPPAMPTFTAGDIIALLGGPSGLLFGATVLKFEAFLANVFWPLLCDCSSGVSVVPGPSAYPPLGPGDNTPGPSATPCRTVAPQTVVGIAVPNDANWDAYFPDPGLVPTTYVAHFTSTVDASGGGTFQLGVRVSDGVTLTPYLAPAVFSFGNSGTVVVPLPPSFIRTSYSTFHGVSGGGFAGDTVTVTGSYYCNGAYGGCGSCPPDPALQAQIDQILELVTLIQRQSVPFGYVASTVHAGLSGAGAISISGLLGIKVAITTLPGYLGSAGTSPPIHFDAGFITFGTADGFPGSHRLERNPQVILPLRCSAYTDLDYDLAPGVVVTITELMREP